MKYRDLFNEIQLSRDYFEDEKTGVNWRYHVDDEAKRVYVEFQETKTDNNLKDWFYNFLVIPKKVKNVQKQTITVALGFYLQADAAITHILSDLRNGTPYLPCNYEWYFTGWSLGGAVAGITGFILGDLLGIKRHLIMYGTPAYCLNQKSVETLESNFSSVKNFLYDDDWIEPLVPLYKRGVTENVMPYTKPDNLDARHRVYGHAEYYTEEF